MFLITPSQLSLDKTAFSPTIAGNDNSRSLYM